MPISQYKQIFLLLYRIRISYYLREVSPAI
nr:MAG TPA: hypothetical protein [Caudoviricetes sp.]